MMRAIIYLILILVSTGTSLGYAWNTLGHQIVAQIAYDNLNSKAKQRCDEYNHALKSFSPRFNFIMAAAWLDKIRGDNIHWYDSWHYISIPFSDDHSTLPYLKKINALWAISQSIAVLSSKKSTQADKGFSLRVLIHLIGDIHQPLHTINKISKKLPQGDLGGNLFPLGKNSIGTNLHQYWDRGGGYLLLKGKNKRVQINNKVTQLEEKWPCSSINIKKRSDEWVREAHNIALNKVYRLSPYKKPNNKYRVSVQKITKKQLLLAGCRLAKILNELS